MHKLLLRTMTTLCLMGLLSSAAWSDNNQLLLEYDREFSLMAEQDNAVRVQLFADGLVQVHYPFFMRLAGDYRYQLTSSELQRTIDQLQQLGLDTFNTTVAKQSLNLEKQAAFEAARLPGNSVTIITDPEITHIRVHGLANTLATPHQIDFIGARNDAQLYPQVTILSDLVAALDILDAFTNDTRMQFSEVTP